MIKLLLICLLFVSCAAPKMFFYLNKAELEAWKKANPNVKIIDVRDNVVRYKD